jgi:hypothetical protein
MFYVRQGATHRIVIGPVVAVGDGFTPVTTLTLSGADEKAAILHDNGTIVSISAYTFAAITRADGYYHLTLQSGISNTVGHVTIAINDDSLCLPVRQDFTVVEEAVYDALYAASAPGYVSGAVVNATQLAGQTITAAAGVTFPSSVASPTNITAGTITTVTTLTNLPTIPANWLTAAGTAADFTTEIQVGLATASDVTEVFNVVESLSAMADAIVADTNELQTDWANGGRLDLILDARASQTSVDDLPTNAELATSQASADDATLAAIAALNNVSLAGIFAGGDIDGYSLEEALKLALAALAGEVSGAATTTVSIRAADDSKVRITATVDADGNRTALTLDETG